MDQLAVAIEKARLVQELTHTLEDLKSSYRQITQETWQNFLRLPAVNMLTACVTGGWRPAVQPPFRPRRRFWRVKP